MAEILPMRQINQSINQTTNQSINQSTNQSINPNIEKTIMNKSFKNNYPKVRGLFFFKDYDCKHH